MPDSRISGLYKLAATERIDALVEHGWLSAADAERLRQGRCVLPAASADAMVENAIGIFGLPLAVAPNFIVNGTDYVVPMVIEEPSVVAALSNAARLARSTGGFQAAMDDALLVGQVFLVDAPDAARAVEALHSHEREIVDAANALQPRLVARGGGVRGIEVRRFGQEDLLALHLLVDTCDAMGANLVNTVCEGVAARIAEITGGRVAMRILSNLADRSLVTATVRYSLHSLGGSTAEAEATRDGVVTASRIAALDPYRAATHNKGIMNGIDALAIATGNDWRAIEAGAHAYAALEGHYAPLATWSVDPDDGALFGVIRIPLKVGTVGGTLPLNPAARLSLAMTGVTSAGELAGLMAAVGLAQNFAAIRALATTGIQEGHMRMHNRSVRAARRADAVAAPDASMESAAGKVILLGEHAVVYGRHALAVPIPAAMMACATPTGGQTRIRLPDWDVDHELTEAGPLTPLVRTVLESLDVADACFDIEVRSNLPRGMGLGSSAALAVAVARAVARAAGQAPDNDRVNAIAFACERLAHGTPSGIDNTVATFARPTLFRKGEPLEVRHLETSATLPLVVAMSRTPASTADAVAGVRARREAMPERVDAIFDEMDALALEAAAALEGGDYDALGAQMNLCQGLLNAIGVSTAELEGMIAIARAAGATGAKLTGAGTGGAIVALCPGAETEVSAALEAAGFQTLGVAVGDQPT